MNNNAQKLVTALRSGEFKQGYGRLRAGNSFCCLGVACEVYRRETGEGEWSREQVFLGAASVLPDAVREWLGFQDSGGEFATTDGGYSLLGMNDGGAPFERIADTIESEPGGLFA